MRYRTTFFLLVVAAGIFAWIMFRELPRNAGPVVNQLYPGYHADSISEIEIVSSNQTIFLVRDQRNQWQMEKPIDYSANKVIVEQLLATMPLLTRRPVFVKNQSSKVLEAFGLNPPSTKLTLTGGNQSFRMELGNNTISGDETYFVTDSVPGVYLVPDAVSDYISSPVDFWRDLSFLDIDFNVVTGLKITGETDGFSLARRLGSQKWTLTQPLAAAANSLKIDLLLDTLGRVEVEAFVPSGEVDDFVMGLDAPSLSLEFLRETNQLLKIDFGRSPATNSDQIYVRHSASTNAFLVSTTLAEVFRKPYTDFRDEQLLDFSVGDVGRIEVSGAEAFSIDRGEGDSWQIGGPFTAAADPQLVDQFLRQLTELKIRAFDKDVVADFSSYRLDSPIRQIILRAPVSGGGSSESKPVASLAIGTNNPTAKYLTYVRANGANSVVSIDYTASIDLPTEAYELRDRKVWEYDMNSVTGIRVKDGDAERFLTRRAENDWDVAAPFSGFVNPFEIESAVGSMSVMNALSWRGKGEEYKNILGFNERQFVVTIVTSVDGASKDFKVSFGKRSPGGDQFASVDIDDEPIVFEYSGTVFQLVEKFLAIPKDDAKPVE